MQLGHHLAGVSVEDVDGAELSFFITRKLLGGIPPHHHQILQRVPGGLKLCTNECLTTRSCKGCWEAWNYAQRSYHLVLQSVTGLKLWTNECLTTWPYKGCQEAWNHAQTSHHQNINLKLTNHLLIKEQVTRFWADLDGRDVLKEAMRMVYGLLLLPFWCTVDPDLTVLVRCQQAAAVCPTEVGWKVSPWHCHECRLERIKLKLLKGPLSKEVSQALSVGTEWKIGSKLFFCWFTG